MFLPAWSQLRKASTSLVGTMSAIDIEAGSKHAVQEEGLAGERVAPVNQVRVDRRTRPPT